MSRINYIDKANFISSGNKWTKSQVYDGQNLIVGLTSASEYICFRFSTQYIGKRFRICWDEFYTEDIDESRPVGRPLLRSAYYNGSEWKAPFYLTQTNFLSTFLVTKYFDFTIPDDVTSNYEIYFTRNSTVDSPINLVVKNLWILDLDEDVAFEGLAIHRTTKVPAFKIDNDEHLYFKYDAENNTADLYTNKKDGSIIPVGVTAQDLANIDVEVVKNFTTENKPIESKTVGQRFNAVEDEVDQNRDNIATHTINISALRDRMGEVEDSIEDIQTTLDENISFQLGTEEW